MSIPKNRSYLGIAKETRPAAGSAPTAVAATDFIPFTTFNPIDNVQYLDDKGIRGSMVDIYGQIQGNIWSTHDLGGDLFPDTFGYILGGLLGDVVTTASTAPYTHTFAVLNSQSTNGQPPTFTLSDYYGLGAASTRQFAGCQFSEVDVKFTADGLMTYAAKALGYASAVASVNPTASFSTVTPAPTWSTTVTLAASVSAVMAEGNIKISRPVTPVITLMNSQRPYQLFAGPVSVDGNLTLVFESDVQLQYYLSNTQPSLVIDFSAGAGASLTEVKFTMTKCAFVNPAKIDRSKDWVELSVAYKGVANTTDVGASTGYSPVKAVLQNAKASGTYA